MEQHISRLIDIVGNESVFNHPDLGESVSLDHTLVHNYKASFLAKPGNVDQVQKIVQWANETKTPLVPISSDKPHFRGDTNPTAPEAVIVDLSGMQRILKINRRNRLALIEPGVTFSQLLPEIQKEGLRINLPLLPRANKSVITSLLEREPLLSPRFQWNFLDPLRSLEMVWGNGDKFWSGNGTFRGEREEDWDLGLIPVQGPGPGQLDFYKFVSAAQGSMGIVTWASIKCEALPEIHKVFYVASDKLDDLIEFMYKLIKFRFGDELFIVNRACMASMLAREADEIASLKNIIPPWIAVVGISGGQILAHDRVEAQESDIQDFARQYDLKMQPELEGGLANEQLKCILEPSKEPYWKLRYKGGSQEIFFLTTLDKTPGFLSTMYSIASEHLYLIDDIGVYIQPVHQGVACHCEFQLPFDRDKEADVTKTTELFRDASQKLFSQKAYFSRPYGIWADMVYSADARTTAVTRKMKDIFDPNHVMNPGKLCF
ncbi:MAG TPA: FAD-binding oxidoreductase [Anaerolineales bacterium]|nr:FAD-binding oxidoreductase [Anaerolineales bacterium]